MSASRFLCIFRYNVSTEHREICYDNVHVKNDSGYLFEDLLFKASGIVWGRHGRQEDSGYSRRDQKPGPF